MIMLLSEVSMPIITRATDKDKEILREMINETDNYHYENCPTFAKAVDKNFKKHKEQSNTLIDRVDASLFYILKIYNKPVGTIMVWDNNGETTLTNLYIDERYRSKGYGKILLDYVIDNMETSYCVLGVFEENTKALNFYYRYGFKYIQLQKTDQGNLLWLEYLKEQK